MIACDPASYVDPQGRLFDHPGGPLVRGIRAPWGQFYRDLVERKVGKGKVIETRLCDLQLEGFELVLEHRRVTPRTYCVEWPPEMLQRAALLTLDLALELAEEDLTLQDAYPWNVLFEGTEPVFVDFTSIRPAEPGYLWKAYQQFLNFFLYPLYVHAAGLGSVARQLQFDYLHGLPGGLCSRLLPASFKWTHPQVLTRLELPEAVAGCVRRLGLEEAVRRAGMASAGGGDRARASAERPTRQARLGLLRGLRRDVARLRFPHARTVWTDYQAWQPYADDAGWSPKQRHIRDLLRQLRPEVVLDVACNRGWYAGLAAAQGARVVAFDQDESCVSSLYHSACQNGWDLLPLRVDLLQPPPAFGWQLRQFPSFLQRVQGDLVLALALVHHLVIAQWQSFDRVAELLGGLTRKWLVLEWVPAEDEMARRLLSHGREVEEYTLDALVAALRKVFTTVEVLDEGPGRQLLLATR